MTWTMAIETGGTFTDLFMIGPDGRVLADKVPSTPAAPERAVRAALLHGLELAGIDAACVGRLLHGSTVAVNAPIERKASLPAVIATRGFRDMLFIGRQDKIQVYDFAYRKPEPFTDRALVFEVGERLGPDGTVVTPLDDAEVAALVDRIAADEGVASVAVCLLHSYANPAHEQRIAEILAERQPHLQVTLSSDVCPVHREYERTSTTVINAFLRPVVDTYLGRLETLVAEAGCTALPLIMQANGGVLPVSAARRRPAEVYLSGPAAAVAGAARLARDAGLPSLITLDVGGTSSDICIVTDGAVAETGHGGATGQVQHQPLNMVMTDIVTIGAGGGSLAWVDGGGMLKVGPLSAGADPGPACYGRGGTGYALTDALLNLGLLADGAMLPGGIRLDRAAAEAALQDYSERAMRGLIERAHPFVRIQEYALVQDTGGAGTHRGGLGIRKRYEVLVEEVLLSTNGDRQETAPWGLVGGQEGSRTSHVIERAGSGERELVPAASVRRLYRGDVFEMTLPGGAGWGPPERRALSAIQDDLRTGRVSEAAARATYPQLFSSEAAAE